MSKNPFQTNINTLNKVRTKLVFRQKMNHTQVILCDSNNELVIKAIESIDLALKSLNEIK